MPHVQLFEPSEFRTPLRKRWDERDPITGTSVSTERIVSGVEDFYSLDGTVSLTVNESGPVVRSRRCGSTDFECNFRADDAILVARDPSPATEASEAPIRLRFSQGIRAAGAWVAVSPRNETDPDFIGQPLFGCMWLGLESDRGTWRHFVLSQGITGQSVAHGAPVSAPFVGARAEAGDRILEVRFDASLMGNRRFLCLALSGLMVEL